MEEFLVVDAFNFTMAAASVALYSRDESSDYSKVLEAILKSMIKKLQCNFLGHKVFVVWDTYGGTHFRKEIYPDYKATRDNSKTDFEAVRACDKVYSEFGCINVYVPECEADDAMFVLCKCLREKWYDSHITIVSRDHDLLQVVQAGYADAVWDNTKKKFLDVPAYSVVDMKSLTGDPSDNIKGVPGIGPKTAVKILSGFQKLDESQTVEFERCKSIIDATRHPRFQENTKYIKNNYLDI